MYVYCQLINLLIYPLYCWNVALKLFHQYYQNFTKYYHNLFMSSGKFPIILKTGIVSPVYKKGKQQLFDNYRPISTLPIFSKLYEKIIYKRIYSYLITKNILYDKQFGFRKNHSTSHTINYSIKYIADNLEQKKTHYWNIFRSQ